MRALMSNTVPQIFPKPMVCGVQHFSERDIAEFEVPSNMTRIVEDIFDTTYEVSIDVESAFGRRTIHRYGQPNMVRTPEAILTSQYAQQIGNTAIVNLYVIGFSTVNESVAALNDATVHCAVERLKKFSDQDFGSSLILIEKSASQDEYMRDRAQNMYAKISELGLPSVCIAQSIPATALIQTPQYVPATSERVLV